MNTKWRRNISRLTSSNNITNLLRLLYLWMVSLAKKPESCWRKYPPCSPVSGRNLAWSNISSFRMCTPLYVCFLWTITNYIGFLKFQMLYPASLLQSTTIYGWLEDDVRYQTSATTATMETMPNRIIFSGGILSSCKPLIGPKGKSVVNRISQ